ncbi:uncharacterized protein LOC122320342 [Drosophila ficusphila]|uniref:uncharacterized protein LOC122320342 n=1 Tax=Drosophila ficusphila TaxID=30025 RepID=UPI001C894A80|nr:uncharacterized protein LOC122320342 [Drosophila ficusphila]
MSAVILNWRQYQYMFSADIQRMYRCIDVHPDDSQYQRILWRAADGNINEYCLTTVTFGTAPYTAIRVMHKIAEDENQTYPEAVDVLKHEMYVDDILSGAYSIRSAEEKRLQVTGAIKSAYMELRKWSCNHASLLSAVPAEHQRSQTLLNWDNDDIIKTLGLYWLPNQDAFKYKIHAEVSLGSTKRIILSNIARLFDPLGLIAPVIVSAKLIIKDVTMAKQTQKDGFQVFLGWDGPVPEELALRWKAFRTSMQHIDCITIPRWLRFTTTNIS